MPGMGNVLKLPRMDRSQRRAATIKAGEFLQAAAEEASLHVYNTMMNDAVPPDLRLRAALEILDRSVGKAVGKVDQKILDATEERMSQDFSQVPTDRLEQALATIRGLEKPEAIDVEFEDTDFELD